MYLLWLTIVLAIVLSVDYCTAYAAGMPAKLPWIFPGAPLHFNGAPGNIQGNLTAMD